MASQAETVPVVKIHTHLAACPHCDKELRVAAKYVGQEVNCRFCSGRLRVESDEAAAAARGYRVLAIALDTSVTTEGAVPHWPAAIEERLNEEARQGYRFVRSFVTGEHLGIVLERVPAAG